jgi:hypothetical protein
VGSVYRVGASCNAMVGVAVEAAAARNEPPSSARLLSARADKRGTGSTIAEVRIGPRASSAMPSRQHWRAG